MTIVPPPSTTPLREINPPKWPCPRGYSHAMAGTGTFVFIGGQIATDNAGQGDDRRTCSSGTPSLTEPQDSPGRGGRGT